MSRKLKPQTDPLNFQAVIPADDLQELLKASQGWDGERALALTILTKNGHELAQAAWVHGNGFVEMLDSLMNFEPHAQAELDMVKSAVARMIAVGRELSDHGKPPYVTGDPEPAVNT